MPDHAPTLTILTGASRGLGAALAAVLLDESSDLLCLSRGRNASLDDLARARGRRLEQWQVDLAEPLPVAERLKVWLVERGPGQCSRLVLINNAALLEPPGPFQRQSVQTIREALRVGLEAPLLLSAAMLCASEGWGVPRQILHISSGLGRRPMAGVATYCASKAGLDHHARSMAEEFRNSDPKARIVALAPGIIETDMQAQLRGADPGAFAAQPIFADFKASGALDTPMACARRIAAFLADPRFGEQPVTDLRVD